MDGLTGNDLALAQQAVQINIAWWKKNGGGGHARSRISDLQALNKKLDGILNTAFPPDELGEIDDSRSDDVLLSA